MRAPWVGVPTARTSGVGNSGHQMAFLVGVDSFYRATLDRLYRGGRPEYLKKFQAALDDVIAKGFILAANRQAILGLAPLMPRIVLVSGRRGGALCRPCYTFWTFLVSADNLALTRHEARQTRYSRLPKKESEKQGRC